MFTVELQIRGEKLHYVSMAPLGDGLYVWRSTPSAATSPEFISLRKANQRAFDDYEQHQA